MANKTNFIQSVVGTADTINKITAQRLVIVCDHNGWDADDNPGAVTQEDLNAAGYTDLTPDVFYEQLSDVISPLDAFTQSEVSPGVTRQSILDKVARRS